MEFSEFQAEIKKIHPNAKLKDLSVSLTLPNGKIKRGATFYLAELPNEIWISYLRNFKPHEFCCYSSDDPFYGDSVEEAYLNFQFPLAL